jgi:hypothetical protein
MRQVRDVIEAGLYVCAAELVVILCAKLIVVLLVAEPPVLPVRALVQPVPPAVSVSSEYVSPLGPRVVKPPMTRVAALGGVIGPIDGVVPDPVAVVDATSSVTERPENSLATAAHADAGVAA